MITVQMNFLLANQGQIYLFLLTALGYLINKKTQRHLIGQTNKQKTKTYPKTKNLFEVK